MPALPSPQQRMTCALLLLLASACPYLLVDANPTSQHDSHHHRVKLVDNLRSASSSPTNDNTNPGTAIFQQIYWDGNTHCQTVEPQVLGNYATGGCQPSLTGSTGSATWYCDTSGGYYVQYASNNCTGNINLINKFDLGCNENTNPSDIFSEQYVCLNPESGPSPPFSWPPPGYIVTTTCGMNTLCAVSEGFTCLHAAIPANECGPSPIGGSQMTFCSEDEEWIGVATYLSDDCSDPAPINVQHTSTLCNATYSNVQCGGTPLPASQYASTGVFSTNSPSCQPGPGSQVLYQPSGSCFNFAEYTCPAGTGSGQLSVFQTGNAMCHGSTSNFTLTFQTNECITENTSTGLPSIYFCSGY